MRFRVINHQSTPGHPGPALPEALLAQLRQDFSNCLITFNLHGVDLEAHFFGRFDRIPTIAWTAGGKVALMFERDDSHAGHPFWLPRNERREFLVFLMFHELGHNYWPPESIIPSVAAQRLYIREGRRPRTDLSDVHAQTVDILVNTHIARHDISKLFPQYTGRGLVMANWKRDLARSPFSSVNLEDPASIRTKWASMPIFLKWQLYFYHNETLPVPNSRVLPQFRTLLSKKPTEPVPVWKDEFYPLFMDILEGY